MQVHACLHPALPFAQLCSALPSRNPDPGQRYPTVLPAQPVPRRVTLSIFPGVLAEDLHSTQLGSWYPIVLLAAYNCADAAGKAASGWRSLRLRCVMLVTHSRKRAQRLVLSRLSKIAVIKLKCCFFLLFPQKWKKVFPKLKSFYFVACSAVQGG